VAQSRRGTVVRRNGNNFLPACVHLQIALRPVNIKSSYHCQVVQYSYYSNLLIRLSILLFYELNKSYTYFIIIIPKNNNLSRSKNVSEQNSVKSAPYYSFKFQNVFKVFQRNCDLQKRENYYLGRRDSRQNTSTITTLLSRHTRLGLCSGS